MSWLFEPEFGRPIDAAVANTIAGRWPDVPHELLRLFAATSFATGQGHSALDLAAFSTSAGDGLTHGLRAALTSCPAVDAAGSGSQPFVLDHDLLYLRRFHEDEVRLADGLRQLSRRHPVNASPTRIDTAVRTVFADVDDLIGDRQVRACLLSTVSRLTVVLGGPGTGKTTTVLRLLALHQFLADAPLKIAVAAPTGKAAARVADAMRIAADRIGLDTAIRAVLPERAMTLHRLLGARTDGTGFRHGAMDRLPYDLVIVDEASMVDLGLFRRTVEAMPDHARLVILGDPDQLEAIESGAVLAELARLENEASTRMAIARLRAFLSPTLGAQNPDTETADVAACVVRLTRGWRFGPASGVGQLSEAVRSGNLAEVDATLDRGLDDLTHIDATPSAAAGDLQIFVRDNYEAAAKSGNPSRMLAAHQRFRVLAATRAEVARANSVAARSLGQSGRDRYPEEGLPFVIERNDSLRQLNNGDTGVFSVDDSGAMRAWFQGVDIDSSDGTPTLRSLAPHEIGPWQPAYAMTVHRAQGSEYDQVMVLLPTKPSGLTSRSWLYTAISRARRHLVLVGAIHPQLTEVVATVSGRISGLARRLI